MPLVGGKGKSKGRDGRRSRSRNTTPSSVGASTSTMAPTLTAFLDTPLSHLMVPANLTYDDLLERHGSASGIPEPKHLDSLMADLRSLAQLAELRGQVCDKGMRYLSRRRKERLEEERERERESREHDERKEKLKREAAALRDDDDDRRATKASKLKKRKDRSKVRDERPLTHGAHGATRQDGLGVDMQEPSSSPERRKGGGHAAASPDQVKGETGSVASSPLSPASQPASPTGGTAAAAETGSEQNSRESSSSLSDHQPAPAKAVPQFQTFGPDPTTFDDPTIYHIREVKAGMSEEEIKQIYSVASYPHDDLHDLIPGTPPDRDFSNAKPTNQVAANTFAGYIEPYFRPLTEEDVAFLRERVSEAAPPAIHLTDGL